MTKKKILVLALALAMAAILAVGGSLAYFTDTASQTNTFTAGSVKIDLIEQEKLAGEALKPYKDGDKTLMPGTSTDGNAVSKIVTVKNTGKSDAWVWVELEIPKYLVSKDYPTDESRNALHWDGYDDKLAKADGIIDDAGKTLIADMVDYNADNAWYDYKYVGEKDGYVIIRTMMKSKLPAGKISLPCLAQVYMDWRVKTNEDGTQYLLPDGTSIYTTASWKIIVNAYAIQADGIASVQDAVDAYTNNGK